MTPIAPLQLAPEPAHGGGGRPELRVVEGGDAAAPPAPRVRFELPGYDLAQALALERELGIGHVLAQVLVRRGLGRAGRGARVPPGG